MNPGHTGPSVPARISETDTSGHGPAMQTGVVLPAILFESADLLAVNKPEGLASIPERRSGAECLLKLLEAHFSQKLWVVHRVDKEVSGVILFARNAAAHAWMNDLFSTRKVTKAYRAIVHGVVQGARGAINRPIRQFGSGRMGIDERQGKPCITKYTVLERLSGYSVIEARPVTGRRHQLRVHFYSIGHPIVGDVRYGDLAVQSMFPRLMLHAHKIGLKLSDGTDLRIEAPFPQSFTDALAEITENHHSVVSPNSSSSFPTPSRSGNS